jgi:hypothetical protein
MFNLYVNILSGEKSIKNVLALTFTVMKKMRKNHFEEWACSGREGVISNFSDQKKKIQELLSFLLQS